MLHRWCILRVEIREAGQSAPHFCSKFPLFHFFPQDVLILHSLTTKTGRFSLERNLYRSTFHSTRACDVLNRSSLSFLEMFREGQGRETTLGTRSGAGVRAGCNACSDARFRREFLNGKGPAAHAMKIVRAARLSVPRMQSGPALYWAGSECIKGIGGAQRRRTSASVEDTGRGVASLPKAVIEVIRLQCW